jgi:hypothetical protein
MVGKQVGVLVGVDPVRKLPRGVVGLLVLALVLEKLDDLTFVDDHDDSSLLFALTCVAGWPAFVRL